MSSLSGKVAIVTGSSRGIGARIATRLAQAGAGVVVTTQADEMPRSKPFNPSKPAVDGRWPFKET